MIAALGIACQRTPDVPRADPVDTGVAPTVDSTIEEVIADAVAEVRDDPTAEPFPGPPNGPVYGAPPVAEKSPRTTSEYEFVIRSKRKAMRRCAEKVDGGTHGKTKISLEIAADGTVSKATAEPGELASEAVACILEIARGMKFSKADAVARIVFPLEIAEP